MTNKKQKSSAVGIILVILAAALSKIGLLPAGNEQVVKEAEQAAIEVIQEPQSENDAQTVRFDENQPSSIETPSYKVERMEIPVYRNVANGERIDHTGYSLYYSGNYKTPLWVAWELTREEATQKNVDRETEFTPDPDVQGAKAHYYDYNSSGYDRGHMAPAADMKWSIEAMTEAFYTSNICPQNHELNAGDWNDLEMQTRYWAKKYGKVYVTCGPIYKNTHPKRIGKNKVAVPDAFFKVLLFYKGKNNPVAVGFIFDNNGEHKELKERAVSVDSVEKLVQMDFFSLLNDDVENKIEANVPKLFH